MNTSKREISLAQAQAAMTRPIATGSLCLPSGKNSAERQLPYGCKSKKEGHSATEHS